MALDVDINETLRECCCIGDLDGAISQIRTNGANIDSQNRVNGWTALHWASKRGHKNIVKFLVENGANRDISNNKGERPIDLAANSGVKFLLEEERITNGPGDHAEENGKKYENVCQERKRLALVPGFVPNYMAHPVFPYGQYSREKPVSVDPQAQPFTVKPSRKPANVYTDIVKKERYWNTEPKKTSRQNSLSVSNKINKAHISPCPCICMSVISSWQSQKEEHSELILKVRIANSGENDFIEIDLDVNKLTYKSLLCVCSQELNIDSASIKKVRKLPNTIVRNDKDVQRLLQYQELEVFII